MPIFDFKCENCGFVEEFILRLSDPLPVACSKCGGPVKKLMPRSFGISFKGSGFYVTDSRKSTSYTAPGSTGGDKKPAATPAQTPEKKKPDTGSSSSPASSGSKPSPN